MLLMVRQTRVRGEGEGLEVPFCWADPFWEESERGDEGPYPGGRVAVRVSFSETVELVDTDRELGAESRS